MNTNFKTKQHPLAITIYFPFRQEGDKKDRTKNQQTKLKAFIESKLRTEQRLSEHKDLRLQVVDEVKKIGGGLDYSYEGIGIFISLDPENREIKGIEHQFYNFLPPKIIHIASHFYLTPALQQHYLPNKVYGVAINRYGCRITSLQGNNFQEVEFLTNNHIIMDEVIKEEMKNYQSGYGWWNTGEDTSWINAEEKRFLKEIKNTLDKLKGDGIKIYISSNIEKIQPAFEDIFKGLPFDSVSYSTKGMSSEWSLKDELFEYQHEIYQRNIAKNIKDIEQNGNQPSQFVDDFIQGKIATVVVNANTDPQELSKQLFENMKKYKPYLSKQEVWTDFEQESMNQGIDIITSPNIESLRYSLRF